MTSGQILVKVRIIPPVQLIDWHLPDCWMRPAGAVASITVTLVRHPVNRQFSNSFQRFIYLEITCSQECRARWAHDQVKQL